MGKEASEKGEFASARLKDSVARGEGWIVRGAERSPEIQSSIEIPQPPPSLSRSLTHSLSLSLSFSLALSLSTEFRDAPLFVYPGMLLYFLPLGECSLSRILMASYISRGRLRKL
jgi:hypothetical protein